MPQDKPNILIIWGDDIGWFNVSAYNHGHHGLPHAEHRPHRPRRGASSPTGTASRAAPPAARRSSPARSPIRTGLTKVGLPGARPRAAAGGPDHRRAAQTPRLRHRPVRQEPPRRPQRVPADRARLRRVLRQPLPPQRRRGAGGPGLPERSPVSEQFGPRGVMHSGPRTRRIRPSIQDAAPSASRRSRTPAR